MLNPGRSSQVTRLCARSGLLPDGVARLTLGIREEKKVRYTAPGGCCRGAFAASNLDHDGGVDLGDLFAFANNFTAQVR